jgi:dihydroxyacetone kinase-like protein
MELYIVAGAAIKQLESRGLVPVRHLIGAYVTSLDMAGCSLTVSLVDDESLRLWDAPVHTAALRWGI